jgi:hypothetical protein
MENFLCRYQNAIIGIVFEKFPDIQPALISISFPFEEVDGRCIISELSFTRPKRGKEHVNII